MSIKISLLRNFFYRRFHCKILTGHHWIQVAPGGDREFVAILCAARSHGLELVEAVCAKALQDKTIRAEVILNLIARALDPPAAEPIPTPDTLSLRHEPVADCARYDALLAEVAHAAA